jgi:hypothetical protein
MAPDLNIAGLTSRSFARGLAIGKRQNAVHNHCPTNTNMQTAIDDAVRPLTERILTLELEMSALRQVMDGRQPAVFLPYTKTKTEAAREMLTAGRSNKEVGTALGLDSAQVKQIKYRLKKSAGRRADARMDDQKQAAQPFSAWTGPSRWPLAQHPTATSAGP